MLATWWKHGPLALGAAEMPVAPVAPHDALLEKLTIAFCGLLYDAASL